MVKLVVFDMAGTVVNENNVVYKTLHRALANGSINVSLEDVLAQGAGKEKFKAIQDIAYRHAPSTRSEEIDLMFQNFLKLLDEAYAEINVIPMEGAEEVFHHLHENKIKVVLNTGYNRATAELLLQKLNWHKGKQYDELVTASDVKATRPQPDMVLLAMKWTGIENPAQVVKVGDSSVDVEEGRNANCGLTIGITTGAHTAAQLKSSNPHHIIARLTDLLTILEIH